MRLVGNSDLQPLDLKKPVERKLHDGDLHQYRLSLREHTFMRLQLIRQAVEVRVIVWGPKGEKLREGTSLSEAIGALPVLFAAEQSGEYRVGGASERGWQLIGSLSNPARRASNRGPRSTDRLRRLREGGRADRAGDRRFATTSHSALRAGCSCCVPSWRAGARGSRAGSRGSRLSQLERWQQSARLLKPGARSLAALEAPAG